MSWAHAGAPVGESRSLALWCTGPGPAPSGGWGQVPGGLFSES